MVRVAVHFDLVLCGVFQITGVFPDNLLSHDRLCVSQICRKYLRQRERLRQPNLQFHLMLERKDLGKLIFFGGDHQRFSEKVIPECDGRI